MDSTIKANAVEFIDVEYAINLIKQGNKSIGYDMSDCNMLLSDTLRGYVIDLKKPYRDIEDLINSPDYIEGSSINMPEIQTPILKNKNKLLVIGRRSLYSYAYILTLIKPDKLIVELVYEMYDNPSQPELQPMTKEDSLYSKSQAESNKNLERFIQRNVNYPVSARNDSVKGSVTISYGIKGDLTVSDYKIEKSNFNKAIDKSVRDDFESEALRVVKLIDFKNPAFHYAELVRNMYSESQAFQYGEPIRLATIIRFKE